MRVGGKTGEEFWTARGLRQVCSLSPIIFNILITDIEDEMAKGGWGGIMIGGEKIYTLSYTDDIVMMAEKEKELRPMLKRMEE